jgi:hypothetical protein
MRERVGTFKNRKIIPYIHILHIILWYDSMCIYVTHQCVADQRSALTDVHKSVHLCLMAYRHMWLFLMVMYYIMEKKQYTYR